MNWPLCCTNHSMHIVSFNPPNNHASAWWARLSTFHGMCARKHMVCVQEQEDTFQFEETLIKMLFTKRKISLKQPGEGRVTRTWRELYEESQLRGAVVFLRGNLEGRDLEKSVSWPHAPLALKSPAVLPPVKQNPQGVAAHWRSPYGQPTRHRMG